MLLAIGCYSLVASGNALLGRAFKALKNIGKQDPLKPNKGKYKMSQSPT